MLGSGGLARNRTGVQGFAVLCVTTPPRGLLRSNSYVVFDVSVWHGGVVLTSANRGLRGISAHSIRFMIGAALWTWRRAFANS